MVLSVDMDAFTLAHRGEWDQLATLVRRRRRLSGAEADELVRLYQRASTHLSQLQASAAADPVRVARSPPWSPARGRP